VFILEWEGGDDWLRAQFKAYLLSMFRTVASNGEFSCCYNVCFYSLSYIIDIKFIFSTMIQFSGGSAFSYYNILSRFTLLSTNCCGTCLQCFDTVGSVSGRESGL